MLKAHLLAGLSALYSFLQFTGRSVARLLISAFKTISGFVFRLFSKVFAFIGGWLKKEFKQPLYEIWCFILTPFAHAWGTADTTRIQLKKSKDLGIKHAVITCTVALKRFFKALFSFLKITFNYAAPIICIAFLIEVIKYAGTMQYTISVEWGGSDLGVIENEADFNQAQALVQDKITYTDNDEAVIKTPKFSVRMMQSSDSPIDTDSLSELMITNPEAGVVEAYGFYINDSLFGVYDKSNMERVKQALEDRLLQNYDHDAVTIDFSDKVEINEGRYLEANITSADEAVAYITGGKTVQAYYVVKKGDSVSSIASDLGITVESLKADNPSAAKKLKVDDILTYHYTEPNLSVVTTHYETYDRVIEREVKYTYDKKVEQYCEILVQRGSAGYENVTAMVTRTNGKESDRIIVAQYTIEEMVPMIIRTGSMPNTSLNGDTHVISKLGTFLWPVGYDGGYSYVSSLYGYRVWDHSNHRALDIAAKRGTEIYAAASGRVVFAGTYSAYGKLTIIDHGGGYETAYGHQSSIDVEKGDWVEKGDVIGHVGMTGSASGNHLHFELRYDDDRIDPILCLGGIGDHEVRNY